MKPQPTHGRQLSGGAGQQIRPAGLTTHSYFKFFFGNLKSHNNCISMLSSAVISGNSLLLPPFRWSRTGIQIVWIVSVIKRWILCKKSYLSDWFHPSTQLLIQSIAAILTVFRFNRDRSFYVWISTSCYDITTLAKKKLQDSVNISAFFVVSPTDAQYSNF